MASAQDRVAAFALGADEVIEGRMTFWTAVAKVREMLDNCSATHAYAGLAQQLTDRGRADLVRGLPV